MSEEDDFLELVPASTADGISPQAKKESEQLENRGSEPPPNSVHLDFGFCKIKWHAESSAPLFCFVSIAVLLIFGVIVALLAIMNSKATWPDEVFKFLGQAVLTLVGAVVGSSASTSSGAARSRRQTTRN